MSRKTIPVRDHVGRRILFYVERERATKLIDGGRAFVLVDNPLELALTRSPAAAPRDGRPDVSLTMPPEIVFASVDGSVRCREIVEAYRKNHRGVLDEADRDS